MIKNLVTELFKMDRNLKQRLLIFCLVFSAGFTTLSGQPFDPFTKITDDNYVESDPVVEGDYIVYSRKNIANDNGIFLYHIPTGDTTRIMSCDHGNFTNIDISGDRIVWQQHNGSDWDIYNYLISRPDIGAYPLIDFEDNQVSPVIHGDILVWVDGRGDNFSANIYMYDIAKVEIKQITTDEDFQQSNPDVYGNFIVYQDGRNGNQDIYLYVISTEEEIQITDNEKDQRNPCIWKKRIVWEDKRNYDWDLYLYIIDYFPDIDPVKFNQPVFTGNSIGDINGYDQINPRMNDDYIVFQDKRNYTWDIYIYTFLNPLIGKTQPLCEEMKGQTEPAIWNNTVVWTDEREYSGSGLYFTNIWMWEKPPGVDLTISIDDDPDPVGIGEDLNYLILVSNFGDQPAYNPSFTFNIPSEVEFLTMSGAGSGGYYRVGDVLHCLLDSIPARTTDTITITVRTALEAILESSALIESVEEDLNPDNNSATCRTNAIWLVPSDIDEGTKPSIAVDGFGRPHFCYLTDYEGKLMYATIRNGVVETKVLDNSEYNYSPAITVDGANNVHIAYSNYEGTSYNNKSLFYIAKKDGSWGSPTQITTGIGEGESVCIRADKYDSLHISFLTGLWSDVHLKYLVKSGGWAYKLDLDSVSLSASFDLDSACHAHFVFFDDTEEGFSYMTNSPVGIWGEREPVQEDWRGGQLESLVCDIAVDHLSRPHVSYVASVLEYGNESYKYAMKSGTSWSDELLELGKYAGSHNSIAVDPSGNPHICFHNPLTERLMYKWKEEGVWHQRVVDIFEGMDIWWTSTDIAMDRYGFSHIVYIRGDQIVYVTNAQPVPEPIMTLSPQSLDFIERTVGDTTAARRIAIGNEGEADLVITDISIAGNDSANFSISRSSCSIITPGDSCSVDVKFNPNSMGDKHASLWITSNDQISPETEISLEGTGVLGILHDFGSLDFGDVKLGDSAVIDYRLTNVGNTSLIVQSIIIGTGDRDDFYYTDFPEVPFIIDDGDTTSFKLVFKPTEEGARSVSLLLYTTGGDISRFLTGTGVIPSYKVTGRIQLPDNSLVDEGWIYLINMDENSPHPMFYYKPLEGVDSFLFTALPEFNISLKFQPDETDFPGYLVTYLGDTPYMEEADVFLLDHDVDDIVINLIEAPPSGTGTASVSGLLIEDEGKKAGMQISKAMNAGEGTPLAEVPVYLVNLAGDIEYSDVTDVAGEFDFETISIGEYLLKVDYNAIPMDGQNDTLKVTDENQEFELMVVISNAEISCDITKLSTNSDIRDEFSLKLYPNPFSEILNLELNITDKDEVIFEIYDLSGRCVLNGRKILMPGTTRKIQIETDLLDEGCYVMRLSMRGEKYNLKLLKL